MPKPTDIPIYDHRIIEAHWQSRWDAERVDRFDVDAVDHATKFYNLVEFPYPSAEGLHVGHAYTYAGADTYGRYLRMRGREVFQPIGFDSFGIHAENYALRVGEHPATLTGRTIARYREQLRGLGAAWSWPHEVVTSDPSYYRWTQWVFLQLHGAGLAERREAPVVWCPSCLTVLAFEQVEGDRCERCGTEVTERVMKQWFLRITAYADRLVDGLDDLDWPEAAKRLQREWIGRSVGVDVDFAILGTDLVLRTFTTRPDTIFGATFVAVAPGHPLADRLAPAGDPDGAGGRDTGAVAVNPANGRHVPVWVSDHVVATYGTGAIMGVPAHDERDHRFALAHGLLVEHVVAPEDGPAEGPWTGEGGLTDSGPFSGMPSEQARATISDWLEERGIGRKATRYRLRDWLISRQRYWGPPIPIVHCDGCGEVPVPEHDLPVVLPHVEAFRPTGTGRSPLAAAEAWVRTECPRCGGPGRRETDVSDNFLDSAWYFLRYPSADRSAVPWDPERTERILPVDLYAGGREHVVRHHLYARFVTMALHDLGHLPFAEPFPRLRLHGLLLSEGTKMSKSRGNVVNPDEYVRAVGADALRTYLLFCGPWEEGGDFSDRNLGGVVRFLNRLWRLATDPHQPGPGGVDLAMLDRTVERVGGGIERLKFNVAIAALMECVRWAADRRADMSAEEWARTIRTTVLLTAPFAPHVCEELWDRLGETFSVHRQGWPHARPESAPRGPVALVVQVDGKVRDRLEVHADVREPEAVAAALASDRVRRHVPGQGPARVVFVPGRLINLVTR